MQDGAMQTTVDLDEAVLVLAKHVAQREGRTLSSLVSDALAAYLSTPDYGSEAAPYALLRRDGAHAGLSAAGELPAADPDDERTSLQIPAAKRRPAP